jgi:glycosyltransferase involved in cell wall biosynthesis
MKTAVVHDWLTGMRGGEKVLDLLSELLPGSDVYTLIYVPGRLTPRIEGRQIVSSWLDRLPGVGRYYRWLLPLMPSAARRLRLDGYDLVVAVSHCVAHGVTVAEGTRFVCYCLTPMRYVWDTVGSYFGRRRRRDLRYWLLRRLSGAFRKWDRAASSRVGEYVSISRAVQDRVKRCYGRESVVIYPPVDTEFYRPVGGAEAAGADARPVPPDDFYLWVGALAPYKRVDLALDAFARLDSRLVVIGDGQELSWAKRNAPPNVELLGRQPDEVLRRYYSSCRALVFPGEEDFGIVPVEAQACGRPVIALARGGVLDTVVPLDENDPHARPTGVFFSDPSPAGLIDAVQRFERNREKFDSGTIRKHAQKFSRERFKRVFGDYLFRRRQEAAR